MTLKLHDTIGGNTTHVIQELFGIQSRAEKDYLHQTFQQTSMSEYLRLIKMHSDNLGQAGSPVPTSTLISQVLLKHNGEYNAIVSTLQGKSNITWLQMQSELLSYEKRLEAQNTQRNATISNNPSVIWLIAEESDLSSHKIHRHKIRAVVEITTVDNVEETN